MKTVIFASLMALSCGAMAGDYSAAVNKQSRCESAGELARSYYGVPTATFRVDAADIQKMMDIKKISKKVGTATRYLMFVGISAKSPKDAYMQGWGWCMDQN